MPAIQVVTDEQIQGHVRDLFEDIKTYSGVPFVDIIFRALGRYPAYLELAWTRIKPDITSFAFQDINSGIRTRAVEGIARDFSLSDHSAWLREHGYRRNDIQEIDYVARLFHSLDPKLLTVTTAWLLSLYGHDVGGEPNGTGESGGGEEEFVRPVRILRDEEVSPRIRSVFKDIQETLSLPLVTDDFRAFAYWPDYLEMAWGELSLIVRSEPYKVLKGKIDVYAATSVRRLPYPFRVSRDDLQAVGMSSYEIDEVLNLIHQFQKMLPGAILNITALKMSLERGMESR